MTIHEVLWSVGDGSLAGTAELVRRKRQNSQEGGDSDVTRKQVGTLDKIKEGFKHEVEVIGDATGLKGWQILLIILIVTLLFCGLCGWCVFRFFKKKRKANKGITLDPWGVKKIL